MRWPGRFTPFVIGLVAGALLALGAMWLRREYYRHQVIVLSEAELAVGGAAAFESVTTQAGGIGPGFNGTSCASCHAIPAIGGWGTVTTLRVARRDVDGTYHAYRDGPVVPLFSLPNHECQAVIPPDANVFSRRLPISTFGSGAIEAIPDEELIALEDPGDRNADGVRGRASRITDRATGQPRIGRFGWKAQHASLLAFAADAYRHELGVTSDLYPNDEVIGVSPALLAKCDTVADPEDFRQPNTGLRSIDGFAAFMKSLPAPVPLPETPEIAAGGRLFERTGCTACHRPQIGTARAFSDFLLHDIGTGDGIAEGDARPNEMRTAALWGIQSRQMYLHDGSAPTINDAVMRHGGEGAGARANYATLTEAERHQLIAFVKSR